MFIEELVVAFINLISWSELVGECQLPRKGRQCTEESRRSQGCGICGKEYQATVVSYAPISGMPYLQYLGLDGG